MNLKWIPYEQFTDIEYLAEGGFSKIYKAKWQRKKQSYEDDYVVLKYLNNSSKGITISFLTEIANTKLVDHDNLVVMCYGLSQEPQTGNYLTVMQYMPKGDLRQYLKSN